MPRVCKRAVALLIASTCIAGFPSPAPAQPAGGQLAKTCKPAFVGKLLLSPDAPFDFIDEACVHWSVPKNAAVDGASIPRFLWTMIGGPWDGAYRKASVIHDWYCFRRSKPWQTVHRMFFEAMLASGVGQKKAKLMYLAVYYRGPRWDGMTIRNSKILSDAAKAVNDQVLLSAASAAKLILEKQYTQATKQIDEVMPKMATNGDQFVIASVKRDISLARSDLGSAGDAVDAMISSGVADDQTLKGLYLDRAKLAYQVNDLNIAKNNARATLILDDSNAVAVAMLSDIERRSPAIANQNDTSPDESSSLLEFQRLANIVETTDPTLEEIDKLVDEVREKR
jgi:hypothetical protein